MMLELEITCPLCGAEHGQFCIGVHQGAHVERVRAAETLTKGDFDRLRLRLIQLVQTAECAAGAVALLGRNDHRYVPEDIRKRLIYVRQQLSIIHSDLTKLIQEDGIS
jgi:hypothetical protein